MSRRLLSVYVAGASAELERAERAIAAVRAEGFFVEWDWAANIRTVGQANPVDATKSARALWAGQGLFAASSADIFWLLMPSPEHPTIGAWVEFGYAQAYGPAQGKGGPVAFVVSGAGHERTIFTGGATCFERDEDALEYIVSISGGRPEVPPPPATDPTPGLSTLDVVDPAPEIK